MIGAPTSATICGRSSSRWRSSAVLQLLEAALAKRPVRRPVGLVERPARRVDGAVHVVRRAVGHLTQHLFGGRIDVRERRARRRVLELAVDEQSLLGLDLGHVCIISFGSFRVDVLGAVHQEATATLGSCGSPRSISGPNSFHLLVADVQPDGHFEPIAAEKAMIRLGDVVAARDASPSDAAEVAVATVRRFRLLAEAAGATELHACATSAMRTATNGDDIVDRIEAETGVAVEVISGRREAELIFGAIRAAVVLEPAPALCFDLGGGSVEIMVGDASGLQWAASEHARCRPPHRAVRAQRPDLQDVIGGAPRPPRRDAGPIAVEVRALEPRARRRQQRDARGPRAHGGRAPQAPTFRSR